MEEWENLEDCMNDLYILSDFGRRDTEIQLDVTLSSDEEDNIDTDKHKDDKKLEVIPVEVPEQTSARDADILTEEIMENLSQMDLPRGQDVIKEPQFQFLPSSIIKSDPQPKGVIPRARGRGKPKPPAARTANFLAPGTSSWSPLPPAREFSVRRDEFPPL